jgi:hypothetical protein
MPSLRRGVLPVTWLEWKAANEYWEEYCSAERMRRLQAHVAERRRKYLAKKLAPKVPARSGHGWRLLDRDHRALEQLAHDVFDLGWHGIPWPEGWRVRWADLRAAQASGMCVRHERLILLAEGEHRTEQELITTVVHELTHVFHPHETHGPKFDETLRRVLAYLNPSPEPVAIRPRTPPHGWKEPEGIVKGRRWGRGGWGAEVPGGEQWEYRG